MVLRHPFDGTNDRAFARCIVVDMLELTQGEGRKVSAGPGSKILRSDFLSRDFVEIRIHVGRGDGVALAGIVYILKQFIAGEVPTCLDDTRKSRIIDIGFVAIAAFAAKTQMDVAPFYSGVPVAQGRQAKASIRLGIFAVANAKEAEFQKPNHRGKHPLAGQTVKTKISADPGSY